MSTLSIEENNTLSVAELVEATDPLPEHLS
jgi:hypothetical protein